MYQDEPEETSSATKTEPRRTEREYESTDEGIVVETETETEPEPEVLEATSVPEHSEVLDDTYDPEDGKPFGRVIMDIGRAFINEYQFLFTEKGDLYLVQKKRSSDEPEELFLIITPEYVFHGAPLIILQCALVSDKIE